MNLSLFMEAGISCLNLMPHIAMATTESLEEIFNEEQREIIDLCISNGQFDSIPSALESRGFFEFTPAAEHALEAYLKDRRPVVLDEESEVRKEMIEKEREATKNGAPLIETPEQERAWQAKLDAERMAKEAKLKGEPVSEELDEAIKAPVEDIKVIDEGAADDEDLLEADLTKDEIAAELTKRGVKFDPSVKKAELSDLLAATLKK
jgi:hypothetical protein